MTIRFKDKSVNIPQVMPYFDGMWKPKCVELFLERELPHRLPEYNKTKNRKLNFDSSNKIGQKSRYIHFLHQKNH